jgi:hypothetical protein
MKEDLEIFIDSCDPEELEGEAEECIKNLCRELCFCRSVQEMTVITDRIMWIHHRVCDILKSKNN